MNCDKCGRPVPADNDVSIFEAILQDEPLLVLISGSRHLLPIFEGEKKVCDGSPSRAQYLEGQPRDARGNYPYKEERVARMRAAYATLQQEAAKAGVLVEN